MFKNDQWNCEICNKKFDQDNTEKYKEHLSAHFMEQDLKASVHNFNLLNKTTRQLESKD